MAVPTSDVTFLLTDIEGSTRRWDTGEAGMRRALAPHDRVIAPHELLARLEDRFRVLTGGNRTALPRQQTLRAMVDWSHDLLGPPHWT